VARARITVKKTRTNVEYCSLNDEINNSVSFTIIPTFKEEINKCVCYFSKIS
jgi:hypothetical protein